MKKDIILSGVGGQGILSIATVIGKAALKDGLYMKQAEVHGMSQRGGDVQSNLRISDQPIASDLIPSGKCDLIISLEPMEGLRYLPFLSPEGWLVTNETPFINIPNYPAEADVRAELDKLPHKIILNVDKVAKEIGSIRVANIVLLGATTPFLGIDYEKIQTSICEIFERKGEAIVEMNLKALAAGKEIAEKLMVDIDDVKAALDVEESSRIELQDGYTLILVDIPAIEIRHDQRTYTTIPLGIILTQDIIVTVCTEDTPVLQNFVRSRVKEFSTKKKLRFVYQILYRTAAIYQANLRIIDKRRTEIEERVGSDTDDSDLINLHELESTLVYFATSLRANGVVLDRLTRYKRLEQYPEDKELLDDVIVENRQAIEMTTIYRDIINGTRELMSSLLDNRLNNVMKYLTSITIVMAIPTVISGIYGMNVNENWMPFANTPHGFLIICIITLLICVITMLFLRKKKML